MSVDYHLLAQAYGLTIPPEDIQRISMSLRALEGAFRHLESSLDFETEPALVLSEDAVSTSTSGE